MTEREIFLEALEISTSEARAAYLKGACAGDVARQRKVEQLLEEHFANDSLLAGSALAVDRPGIVKSPVEEAPAQMIGRYKLLEKVGEGGFGEVWMAEQREPVKRRVALKIIKPGMDSRQVVARFEAERQALAMMDHANIARIFDAGRTDSGRPYFVMELVRGIKITEYCDQNQLPTRERLDLFIKVCHAIQHAHQKGIIHRDIKASNILVTLHDGVPVPKVIDFGIAKAMQQELTDKTLFTQFQQFIGTPAYISPEQAEMTGLDIDTRADIYSLGVLLYELLVGQTPFDAKEMMRGGLDALRQIIREKEPLRPSTKLNALEGDARTTAGKVRQTDVGRLVHQLQGDLDWIVMKCLEKDRTRRYETASGLAIDIERYLKNEPVLARPPSRLYEFQKTVRRHKFGFAAAAALITVLAAGVALSTLQAIRATRAERAQVLLRRQAEANQKKSEIEAAKATAISDFLQEMLSSANPDALKGTDYTVRQMLDDFSSGLGNQFRDHPEVEATVRSTIGRAYRRLGDGAKAQALHERALTLRRSVLGKQHELVAESLVDCAWSLYEQKEWAQAEQHARQALEIYRKDGAAGQPVINGLWVLQKALGALGRYEEVEQVIEEASMNARKTPGAECPDLASMIHGLGELRNKQSRYAEAEALARKAVAMHQRLRRGGDPETAWALVTLGDALRGEKRLNDAEQAYQEALMIFRKQYATGHKSVDAAMSGLRAVLKAKGDPAALVAFHENTLTEQRAAFGNDSLVVAETLSSLAASLNALGNRAEAEKASREAIQIILRLRGQDPTRLPPVVAGLAGALRSQSKFRDAENLYEETIKVANPKLGEPSTASGQLLHDYAAFLISEEKFEASSVEQRFPDQPHVAAAILFTMGGFYSKAGKWDQARTSLEKALQLQEPLLGYANMDTLSTMRELASVALSEGKNAEAKALCKKILESAGTATANVKTDSKARQFRVLELWASRKLVQAHMEESNYSEAEPLIKELVAATRNGELAGMEAGHVWIEAGNLELERGHPQKALEACDASLPFFGQYGRDHGPVQRSAIDGLRGAACLALGDYARAEELLMRALPIVEKRFGQSHFLVQKLYRDLIRLYTKLSRPDETARYKSKLNTQTNETGNEPIRTTK